MSRRFKGYWKWVLGNWWADKRYFFRHQLKDRFKFLKGYSRYQAKEFADWRGSAEARRKTAKHERWASRANAKESVKQSGARFGEFVIGVLTSPFRFASWLFRKINQLRKMSFREACVELWYGYRALIAWGLNRLEFFFFRWSKAPLWLRGISALALIGGIGGVVSLPWVVKAAKSYRSEVIFAEAKELKKDGRIVEAYTKARAAALLDRSDPELLELTTELAKDTRNPELVWWSELNAKASGYDVDSLSELVENASQYRRIRVASRFYQLMAQQYPDHELTTAARVRLLMAQGRLAEANELAGRAFADGSQAAAVHQLMLQRYWLDTEPEARAELAGYFQANILRQDHVGLGIIHMALVNPQPFMNDGLDFQLVLDAAKTHPDIKPLELAMAYGRAGETGTLALETAMQGFYEAVDWEDVEDWDEALRLLRTFQFYEVLEHDALQRQISADEALSELYLESLVMADEPDYEQLDAIINSPAGSTQVALNPRDRAFWLAVLAQRNDEQEKFRENVVRALEFSEAKDWWNLQQVAQRVFEGQALNEFYSESLRQSPNSPQILGGFLNALYRQGNDALLQRILPQVSLQTLSNYPGIQAQVIYLKALYGQDLELCRYYAEDLVGRYPARADNYLVLAFAYYQSQHPEVANKIVQELPVNARTSETNPYAFFCYAVCSKDLDLVPTDKLPLQQEHAVIQAARMTQMGAES
ncbi:hypothetical protein [Cerasicoccus maritimus]|uniref:hypothetical protein n=1 Tax=Cerasicoccus maritimus TaxID=490089 RepID=UPI0028525185|nr:hypothetical protein [Cerasicoccus maritimus]